MDTYKVIRITGASFNGPVAVPVTVETLVTEGLGIHVCGLSDAALKESLLRTVAALQSAGYCVPAKKITVNITPADLRKTSPGVFDLPIALGIIAASGQRELTKTGDWLVAGELGLDGRVRRTGDEERTAALAKHLGLRGVILPEDAVTVEMTSDEGLEVRGVKDIAAAVRLLEG